MYQKFSIIFPLLVVAFMLSGPSLYDTFADIISLKKQIESGIPLEDLACEDGLFKVIRERTNSVACVKTENVEKLVSKGWAKSVDEKVLDLEIKEGDTPIGKINKLYTEPVKSKPGKSIPHNPTIGYDLAFEVCAFSQKIYVPDIVIKSDSETQRYEIPENVEPNTCIISATFIKASDPNSIKITLLNTGDISSMISELESKVSSLQEEMDIAKKSLGDKSFTNTTSLANIPDLRKQITAAKDDLYRLYFTLYASPKEKYTVQKLSFSGTPIEGERANLLSAKRTVGDYFTYDAVFEACAGKKQVNLPVIILSSDKETIEVKLGNKIAPNTCQKAYSRIKAIDPQTIIVKSLGNPESDNKISYLQDQITELDKEIKNERELLRSLIHDPKKPSDYFQQVEGHTTKIIELRNMISSLKAELNKTLYQAYR